MSEIQLIPIELLDDHPDNPRLFLREDVIKGIYEQAKEIGRLDNSGALLVRPLNGRFQIIKGHQRVEAARRAELNTVPCWVREMDDEEALWQLIADPQGERSLLEIGLGALSIEKGSPGRGKKGGIGEYADKMGIARSNMTTCRNGAKVFAKVRDDLREKYYPGIIFLDRVRHFAAIYKTPEELWLPLSIKMLDKHWSRVETQDYLDFILSLDISEKWQNIFLPLIGIIESDKLSTKESVERLIKLAEAIETIIYSYDVDYEQWIEEFHAWLAEHQGKGSWDIRSLRAYQTRLQKELEEAERKPGVIAHEDNITWLEKQEQCDLLLTDPPYLSDVEGSIDEFAKEWLPRALAKVKPTGRAYVFIGAYPDELRAYLNVEGIPDGMTLANVLVWEYRNTIGPSPSFDYKLNWQAILYYRGPEAKPLDCPVMAEQFTVQDINAPDARHGERYHTWEKPKEIAQRFIMHSTSKGDLILDPFAGTGTFLIAGSELGRTAKGCDSDEEMIDIAVKRGCERE